LLKKGYQGKKWLNCGPAAGFGETSHLRLFQNFSFWNSLISKKII
jgi:hypothetical protein